MNVNVFVIFAMEKQYCSEYPSMDICTWIQVEENSQKVTSCKCLYNFDVVKLAFKSASTDVPTHWVMYPPNDAQGGFFLKVEQWAWGWKN